MGSFGRRPAFILFCVAIGLFLLAKISQAYINHTLAVVCGVAALVAAVAGLLMAIFWRPPTDPDQLWWSRRG
ncbi:hypothetical protein QP400_04160 [Winkia sp. UMB3158]|mgnify:CR=1|uniref:Uncharacterized protein n=3 Tax=Winkia TaxID=2692118 RepID=K0YQ19_9ACTO|nr:MULTISPECIES: hypothetical protein [Winkia]MDK8341944.1 hypothetical protein [Winkia sp. UMB3164B]OFT37679.1 hypothetical protein HMPREF3163_07900 [Actinomyces sp. HMSC08A01]PLB79826.1 hypothetical protein CYJ21_08935 [Actinomyces sp. UMB0138]PMC93808.1 hypothetical protein CJ188_00765 [Actinomyces sp. UMB0918]EJZ85927.1 hypothetical protein HMPREF9240_01400 [Winkia neuii BV029A5]